MKYKVKELLERRERTQTACAYMDNLRPLASDETRQTLMIDCDDAESAREQLAEYDELLEELIAAAEINF